MFIDTAMNPKVLAPEERNVAHLAYSSPPTLRSAGALVVGNQSLPYKHSAPPEPACYLVADRDRTQ